MKTKELSKESKVFFIVAAITAIMLFIGGIDSLVDAGFWGFLQGIFTFAFTGCIIGAAATFIYMVAATIAPGKLDELIKKLTTEPKEDYFTRNRD